MDAVTSCSSWHAQGTLPSSFHRCQWSIAFFSTLLHMPAILSLTWETHSILQDWGLLNSALHAPKIRRRFKYFVGWVKCKTSLIIKILNNWVVLAHLRPESPHTFRIPKTQLISDFIFWMCIFEAGLVDFPLWALWRALNTSQENVFVTESAWCIDFNSAEVSISE